MQLILLALVLALLLHDAATTSTASASQAFGPLHWIEALGLAIATTGVYHLYCGHTLRKLGGPNTRRALRAMDRATRVAQLGIAACYFAWLAGGGLIALRHGLGSWLLGDATRGDLVLLDETAAIVGVTLLYAWGWWAYWPIDARLRHARLMRQADDGTPIYPVWTRPQFVVAQLRHQCLPILAPVLMLVGWEECVGRIVARRPDLPEAASMGLSLIGAATIFCFASLMIRYLWDTTPLPPGEIRDRLTQMCREHRVRVRELLLWRTFGGLINAAVIGLIAPARYILLSDALLDQLSVRQVEAVMAHELAHAKKHHIFWLIATAGTSLAAVHTAVAWVLPRVLPPHGETEAWEVASLRLLPWHEGDSRAHLVLGAALMLAGWGLLFGWVSRRFEQQADAFAARHFCIGRTHANGDTNTHASATVDAEDAQAMVDALQRVAELNHIRPARPSWRHGSIAKRQTRLQQLVGCRIDQLPIDRTVRRVNAATLVVAFLLVAFAWS